MTPRFLFVLPSGCLVILAVWIVPAPAEADEVPEPYRETVRKGLEFLVKHQHKDGHWEGDGGKHPVAMTSLAGLALLMEGNGGPPYRGSKHSANARKAVDWLVKQAETRRDGLIFSGHDSEIDCYMEGHGLAVLFLSGATTSRLYELMSRGTPKITDMEQAEIAKLRSILTNAVKYISRAQSGCGGWYHTSKVEGHDCDAILPSVVQIQALQAVASSVVVTPAEGLIKDGRTYLKSAGKAILQKVKPGRKRNEEMAVMLAGLSVHTPSTYGPRLVLDSKLFDHCRQQVRVGGKIELGHDELTHFYYAQAVWNISHEINEHRGGWADYRTATFAHLKASQKQDGSWPAGDGLGVGPVYSTAIWCIVMQLDHKNYPAVTPIRGYE